MHCQGTEFAVNADDEFAVNIDDIVETEEELMEALEKDSKG